MKNLLKVTL